MESQLEELNYQWEKEIIFIYPHGKQFGHAVARNH
jgi:hypothetical protein